MLRSQNAAAGIKHLASEFFLLRISILHAEDIDQFIHRLESVRILRPEHALADVDRAPHQRVRLMKQAQSVVDNPHHMHHLGLCRRILGKTGFDSARSLVENLPRGHAVPACFTRV